MRIKLLLSLGIFVIAAQASTITYNFQLQTSEGYDVHNITMYASDGAGNDQIEFSALTVPASGAFQLTQTVNFNATSAMIVGTMVRNQDSNMDLVMWVSDSFASTVVGFRYDKVFPAGNIGHNVWPSVIASAAGGDSPSLAVLYDFFRRSHTYNPLFDPNGSYSIVEFSIVPPPIGGSIPEPGTVTMIGAGGLAFLVRRKLVSAAR